MHFLTSDYSLNIKVQEGLVSFVIVLCNFQVDNLSFHSSLRDLSSAYIHPWTLSSDKKFSSSVLRPILLDVI